MKLRYSIIALAMFATSAQAENWRLAADTEIWPAVLAFVDTDTIRRSGDTISFSIAMYQEGDTSTTDESWLQNWSGNCVTTDYIVQTSTHYVGATLKERSKGPKPSIKALANAIDEGVLKSACGQLDYLTGKIADPERYADDTFAYLAEEEDY